MSLLVSSSTSLTEQTTVVAVTCAVCFCVVHPVNFTFLSRRLSLNWVRASVFGVLLLLALQYLSFAEMVGAFLHVGQVQPWSVLVIFFTLAYASISLDVTGFSKFLALRVLHRFANPQQKMSPPPAAAAGERSLVPPALRDHVVVYLLSGILALLASNDVVVLTTTPVLIHFCELRGLYPEALLFTEYVAANTFSAFLLVGNPTNIIAGQGSRISFAAYLKLLLLPTTLCVLSTLAAMRWCIPTVDEPWHRGLQGTSAVGEATQEEKEREPHPTLPALCTEDVCMPSIVTTPQGERHFHLVHALDRMQCEDRVHSEAADPLEVSSPLETTVVLHTVQSRTTTTVTAAVDRRHLDDDNNAAIEDGLRDPASALFGSVVMAGGIVALILSGYTPVPMYGVTTVMFSLMAVNDLCRLTTDAPAAKHDEVAASLPGNHRGGSSSLRLRANCWWCQSRVRQVSLRMPWAVAPFAFCMFVLVSLLEPVGITPRLTAAVEAACQLGPLVSSVVGMLVSVAAMQLLNNQPATILLVSVLLGDGGRLSRQYPQEFAAWWIATVLGSNIGACFTPSAALAGIMWTRILDVHKCPLRTGPFVRCGARWMFVPTLVSAAGVYLTTFFVTV